jgi:hypothetical protein
MTKETPDETTDDAQYPTDTPADDYEASGLFPGYFATDREDSGTLMVIADTGKVAKDHTVAAAGQTVAELNPTYPADDPVVFAVYRNALDNTFGETWRKWPPEYLAFNVGDRGVPVYSFPESRLKHEPGEWADAEGDADDADADTGQ